MWLDGLLLYHTLTGSRDHLDAAVQVGVCIEQGLPSLEGTVPERSAAWSLTALCALVEGGQERFRQAMDRAAAILRSRQLESGFMAFKELLCGEEACFEANLWVTSGITVDALFRHFVVTGDERSREAAVRAARAIREHGWDAERNRFFQRVFASRSTGEVISRSGRVSGGPAVLLGLGAARAYQLTGEEAFRRTARSVMEQGLCALRDRPPRYAGEDLALTLRVGLDVIAEISGK
jgi:hypothetical protein